MEGRRHIFIVIMVGSMLLISGCTLLPETDLTEPREGEFYNKKYEWKHKGNTYTWEVPIPISLYEHYRRIPRVYNYDEYVKDADDDEYLALLCGKLEEANVKSDWSGKIDFVLNFVQALEYTDDNATGFDEYPRYPVETLVDEGGDCEDTSILFVSILRQLGYGAALLRFDEANHMAAGVRISEEVIDDWNERYALTYYESEGKCYAYCETTGSGWRIGEKPDWVGKEGALVMQV